MRRHQRPARHERELGQVFIHAAPFQLLSRAMSHRKREFGAPSASSDDHNLAMLPRFNHASQHCLPSRVKPTYRLHRRRERLRASHVARARRDAHVNARHVESHPRPPTLHDHSPIVVIDPDRFIVHDSESSVPAQRF